MATYTRNQIKAAKNTAFLHCEAKYKDAPRFNACVSGAATVDYDLTGDWEIMLPPPGISGTRKKKRRR